MRHQFSCVEGAILVDVKVVKCSPHALNLVHVHLSQPQQAHLQECGPVKRRSVRRVDHPAELLRAGNSVLDVPLRGLLVLLDFLKGIEDHLELVALHAALGRVHVARELDRLVELLSCRGLLKGLSGSKLIVFANDLTRDGTQDSAVKGNSEDKPYPQEEDAYVLFSRIINLGGLETASRQCAYRKIDTLDKPELLHRHTINNPEGQPDEEEDPDANHEVVFLVERVNPLSGHAAAIAILLATLVVVVIVPCLTVLHHHVDH
mmetsp:Transcript_19181/g.38791  ORF Transcript_19181/g.38791 Transcript_19181/m.38791 type:complete len:262 (-) Transcript_19181:469-1254(-)